MPTTLTYEGIGITLAGTYATAGFVSNETVCIILSGAGSHTVTAITNPAHQTPNTNSRAGGAMLNPVPMGTQGFALMTPALGVHVHAYNSTKNDQLSLPLTVVAGDSLIVSNARYDAADLNNKIPVYKVVTFIFLASAPATGSFRPGFFGAGPHAVQFNESDIDWSKLKNFSLASVPSCPSQATVEALFAPLPWMEWGSDWTASIVRPLANTNGTENTAQTSAEKFGLALLWINMNFTQAEKRNTVIRLVQIGLDMWSYHQAGGNMYASGSHQTGWFAPMWLAGELLNHTGIQSYSRNPYRGTERALTTWQITPSDVGRGVDSGCVTFTNPDIGKYWWGISHLFEPNKDTRLNHPYRFMWGKVVGWMLAVRMMDLETTLNWSNSLHYQEQYIADYGIPGGFAGEIYSTFYAGFGPLNATTPSHSVAGAGSARSSYTLDSSRLVTLTSAGSVYFTRNGDDPNTTVSSTNFLYTSPFSVAAAQTVKWRGYETGIDPSDVGTIAFTFTDGRPAPPINLAIS